MYTEWENLSFLFSSERKWKWKWSDIQIQKWHHFFTKVPDSRMAQSGLMLCIYSSQEKEETDNDAASKWEKAREFMDILSTVSNYN